MKLLALFLLATFSSCASLGTSYKPADGRGFGFSDRKVGENKFLVAFRGNGFTSKMAAENFAFQRASEVCAENGKSQLELLQKADVSEQSRKPTGQECTAFGNQLSCEQTGGRAIEFPGFELTISCK